MFEMLVGYYRNKLILGVEKRRSSILSAMGVRKN